MAILAAWGRELAGLLELFLPSVCPFCGGNLPATSVEGFCPACLLGIHPLVSPCCPRCALPYPTEAGSDHLCEGCSRQEPPFAWTVAAGVYEEQLRLIIHRFKYRRSLVLDRPLAGLMEGALASHLVEFRPDLLVPVPLHVTRLRQRGFNQALLVARILGRRLQLPVASRLLRREGQTPAQQGLSAAERARNLKGVFAVAGRLEGQKVLLVDDVMTTAATAREAAQTLLAAGAGAVAVAVLARARRHHL